MDFVKDNKYDDIDTYILNKLKDKDVEIRNYIMIESCYLGKTDIVNKMIEEGATDFQNGLYYASEGNNMDLVKLMIEKGNFSSIDFTHAILCTKKYRNCKIIFRQRCK